MHNQHKEIAASETPKAAIFLDISNIIIACDNNLYITFDGSNPVASTSKTPEISGVFQYPRI